MRGKHKVTRYKHVYIYDPSNLICFLQHYIAITWLMSCSFSVKLSFFTHFYDLPSHVFTAVISSRIETQLFSTFLPCYVIINTLAALSWLTHYLYMCVPRLLPSLSLEQQQLRQCMNNSKITAEGFYDLAKTPSKLHSWALRMCRWGLTTVSRCSLKRLMFIVYV